jgi:hypothetical protein
MTTKAETNFRSIVPDAIVTLIRLIPAWGVEDAAAAFGNAGHESLGFTKLQEMKPTVKGSRGGYGWFQWTGPRRRAFEAYCKAEGLDATTPTANISFLAHELETSERATVAKVHAAVGLEAKTKAFEMAFERPGIAHTDKRLQWAKIALDAYNIANPSKPDIPLPLEKPKAPVEIPGLNKPMAMSTTNMAAAASAATGGISAFSGLDWKVALPVVLILGALAAWIIYQRFSFAKKAKEAGV